MKKITYILGYIAAFASVSGLVFKILHWPLAGIILAVALSLMSIYLFFYVTDKMSDSAEGKILPLHIVAAISASLFTIGVLFKFEHWPGASILLTLGLGVFSLIFLPMLVIQKSKKEGANNLMNSLGAIGLALFVLGVLFKFQHWPGPPVLFIAGTALLFLLYFPIYMLSTTIPHEKKVNDLRDAFFAIIIACLVIFFTMGILGAKLIPPPPDAPPPPMEEVK